MLSVLHPEILQHLHGFGYGLMPRYLPKERKYILVIKATKEGILTVRTKNAFKVYLIKSASKGASHLGDWSQPSLMTIFFYDVVDIDIHDEKYCGNGKSKAKNFESFGV